MRLTVDQFAKSALEYVAELAGDKAFADSAKLFKEIAAADQSNQAGIEAQRGRVEKLKAALKGSKNATAKLLLPIADYLVKKSVWCIGGDGWAYDIGFGGLDHVIASGKNITFSFWIQRFTPTPAARPRNPHRWELSGSLPPAASRSPRRTWG